MLWWGVNAQGVRAFFGLRCDLGVTNHALSVCAWGIVAVRVRTCFGFVFWVYFGLYRYVVYVVGASAACF